MKVKIKDSFDLYIPNEMEEMPCIEQKVYGILLLFQEHVMADEHNIDICGTSLGVDRIACYIGEFVGDVEEALESLIRKGYVRMKNYKYCCLILLELKDMNDLVIPYKVLNSKFLTLSDKVVMSKVLELAGNNATTLARVTAISADIGISRRTVERSLKKLEESKYIHIKNDNGTMMIDVNILDSLHSAKKECDKMSQTSTKCRKVRQNDQIGDKMSQQNPIYNNIYTDINKGNSIHTIHNNNINNIDNSVIVDGKSVNPTINPCVLKHYEDFLDDLKKSTYFIETSAIQVNTSKEVIIKVLDDFINFKSGLSTLVTIDKVKLNFKNYLGTPKGREMVRIVEHGINEEKINKTPKYKHQD